MEIGPASYQDTDNQQRSPREDYIHDMTDTNEGKEADQETTGNSLILLSGKCCVHPKAFVKDHSWLVERKNR